MSVIGSASELPDSPKIEASLNQRTYTREFLVQTSDVLNDGPKTVCAAKGIPRLFAPYVFGGEIDKYALCRGINAERKQPASPYWIVTCRYETPEPYRRDRPAGGERDAKDDNPLNQIPEVETSFEKFEQVIYYIYNLKTQKLEPCKASNGQVFDPPPVKDASRMILTIKRNEDITSPHPAVDIAYQDSVNSDTFWGSKAGAWKCQGISTHRETKQMQDGTIVPYLVCSYKFEARPYPFWDLLVLDAGTYWTIASQDPRTPERKIPFLDDAGHPITGPLDGFGGPLFPQPGWPGVGKAGANPVFNTYRVYIRQKFAALNLPQSFQQIA